MLRCFDRIARTWPAYGMLFVLMSAGCDKEPADSVGVRPKPLTTKAPTETPQPRPEAPRVEAPEARNASPPDRPAKQPVETKPSSRAEGPRVLLSEGHRETCRLTTGDVVPDATVTDIEGTNHQLARLLGDRLTVMVFWSEEFPLAREQFRRLPVDVLAEFAGEGVTVIAVNVGGEIARVRELTGDASDKIVSLVDADASLFQQFATSLLPRTYVFDKARTIVWYDIEYSLSTQRELPRVLRYFLNHDS